MNWRAQDGIGEPRLVFPKWRVAREATLAELSAGFVDRSRAENLSTATQRYYRQTCERWLRFCAERALSDPRAVSPDHLTAYAGWLQETGNNKQSVATWLRGVRALFSWAELRGYVELSPFRMWKLKQPKLPAQRGFGASDVRRMVDVVSRQRPTYCETWPSSCCSSTPVCEEVRRAGSGCRTSFKTITWQVR